MVFLLALAGVVSAAECNRWRVPFDFDWRFFREDKAGAERLDYDDAKWQPVDLPHDFAIYGPFEQNVQNGKWNGFRPLGVGWYRFADQPAILNADLTDAEREALQARVEKLHRHWKKDRDYLPPPTLGTLAELEPALLVTLSPGLEVGYVPIVTRQEAAK